MCLLPNTPICTLRNIRAKSARSELLKLLKLNRLVTKIRMYRVHISKNWFYARFVTTFFLLRFFRAFCLHEGIWKKIIFGVKTLHFKMLNNALGYVGKFCPVHTAGTYSRRHSKSLKFKNWGQSYNLSTKRKKAIFTKSPVLSVTSPWWLGPIL